MPAGSTACATNIEERLRVSRATIVIDVDLHRAAKAAAANSGVSLGAFAGEILREALAKRQRSTSSKR